MNLITKFKIKKKQPKTKGLPVFKKSTKDIHHTESVISFNITSAKNENLDKIKISKHKKVIIFFVSIAVGCKF